MQDDNHRAVLALAAISAVAVVLGLLGWWQCFGFVLWLVIILCAALAYGRDAWRGPIRSALFVMLAVNLLLFLAILLTDRTAGDPVLILGTPVSTAFLIYGIWPMGNLLSVLYFAVFERSVLPPEKIERFLTEFGRRNSAD